MDQQIEQMQIDCGEGRDAYQVVLTAREPDFLERAKHHRDVIGKTGEALVAAIVARSKGELHDLKRMKGGKENDGPKGKPANQIFNERGIRTFEGHKKDGKLNDTPKHEAAHQMFDNFGRPFGEGDHYKDGKRIEERDGKWVEMATGREVVKEQSVKNLKATVSAVRIRPPSP